MTGDQIKAIKDHFDDIDLDKSGTIDIDEVKKYYDKQKAEKIAALRQIANTLIKNNPSQEAYYEKDFEKRVEIAVRCHDKNVEFFMAKDVDNNDVVSWQEFLNYEARAVLQGEKEQ